MKTGLKVKDRVKLKASVEYPHLGFQRLTAKAGLFAVVDKIDCGPGVQLAFYDQASNKTTYGWVNRDLLEAA